MQGGYRSAPEGTYHLMTLDSARSAESENKVGTLESDQFVIEGSQICFQLNGRGINSNGDVASYTALVVSGSEVIQVPFGDTYAGGSNSYRQECIDVSAYSGQSASLRLVDGLTENSHAWAAFDDLTFDWACCTCDPSSGGVTSVQNSAVNTLTGLETAANVRSGLPSGCQDAGAGDSFETVQLATAFADASGSTLAAGTFYITATIPVYSQDPTRIGIVGDTTSFTRTDATDGSCTSTFTAGIAWTDVLTTFSEINLDSTRIQLQGIFEITFSSAYDPGKKLGETTASGLALRDRTSSHKYLIKITLPKQITLNAQQLTVRDRVDDVDFPVAGTLDGNWGLTGADDAAKISDFDTRFEASILKWLGITATPGPRLAVNFRGGNTAAEESDTTAVADSQATSGNFVVSLTVHNPSVAEQQRVAALFTSATALADLKALVLADTGVDIGTPGGGSTPQDPVLQVYNGGMTVTGVQLKNDFTADTYVLEITVLTRFQYPYMFSTPTQLSGTSTSYSPTVTEDTTNGGPNSSNCPANVGSGSDQVCEQIWVYSVTIGGSTVACGTNGAQVGGTVQTQWSITGVNGPLTNSLANAKYSATIEIPNVDMNCGIDTTPDLSQSLTVYEDAGKQRVASRFTLNSWSYFSAQFSDIVHTATVNSVTASCAADGTSTTVSLTNALDYVDNNPSSDTVTNDVNFGVHIKPGFFSGNDVGSGGKLLDVSAVIGLAYNAGDLGGNTSSGRRLRRRLQQLPASAETSARFFVGQGEIVSKVAKKVKAAVQCLDYTSKAKCNQGSALVNSSSPSKRKKAPTDGPCKWSKKRGCSSKGVVSYDILKVKERICNSMIPIGCSPYYKGKGKKQKYKECRCPKTA